MALVETSFGVDDVGRTETLFAVGNGYLGLRGNLEEGRDAHEHGTFVNGFHETFPIRHAEQAYGFAEVGQTIINAPDAKVMRVYVDDEPLSLDVADVREYERTLDMRDGVLRRRIRWFTPSGKEVLVDDDRLVSFEEKHLAILASRSTVLNADAPVTHRLPADQPPGRRGRLRRHADGAEQAGSTPARPSASTSACCSREEYWQDGGRSALVYRVTESGMTIAVVADHIIETENEFTRAGSIEPDIAKNVFRVQAKAGRADPHHEARELPLVARRARARARRPLPPHPRPRRESRASSSSTSSSARGSTSSGQRSDVRIAGHDDIQQAARWCLFQLAQAAARADGQGVPAKGVIGLGLQRPLLLGHRDLRPAVPRLHDPARGRATRCGCGT